MAREYLVSQDDVNAPSGVAPLDADGKLPEPNVPGRLSPEGLSATIATAVPTASTSTAGKVELATTAEVVIGTDVDRAVTPAGARAVVSPIDARRLLGGAAISAGDSITHTNSVNSDTVPEFGDSWFAHLCDLSDGRLRYRRNAAVAGRTSAQVLAGFDAEVLAYAPETVGVMVGANDATGIDAGTITLTQYMDNVKAIVAKLRAAGVPFFWCEITPRGMAAIPDPAAPTLTTATTGGTLVPGTYGYKVVGVNESGTTAASAEATIVVPAGTSTNTVTVTAPARADIHEWRFYGRTAGGTWGLLQTIANAVGVPSRAYADTGATTPGAAPPSTNTTNNTPTAGQTLATAKINAFLRRYCADEKIPLVGMYDVPLDPVTGYFATSGAWGGLHPTTVTQKAMGDRAWAVLAPLTRPAPSAGVRDAVDPTNLHTNPLMISGSGGVATGWNFSALTASLAPRTGFLGQAYTLTRTNPTGTVGTADGPNITTGFAEGDVIEVAFRYELALATGAGEAFIGLRRNGTLVRTLRKSAIDTGPRLWTGRWTVTAATTTLDIQLGLFRGAGAVHIGEVSVRNLTALGIA